MNSLALYTAISRFGRMNYRAKIMIVAFLGTHVPLLAIVGFYLFQTSADMALVWSTLAVGLLATLIGTGVTLFVLNQLLQPVLLTSRALRAYRQTREIAPLPTGFTDEAGTLMADASRTLTQLEQSLRTLETTDATTGLPNRSRFLQTLGEAMGESEKLAIAVLHVPNLPRVAATYDQSVADDMSRVLAERLAQGLGRTAALSRIDMASFAALVPAGEDIGTLSSDMAQMVAPSEAEIAIGGVHFKPELSVGMALAATDGAAAEELLANAVAAAQSGAVAKGVTFHSPAARDLARKSFELEQELRAAIRDEQFTLAFQPVVDVDAGRAVGAEALVRWQHPERGTIAPGVFIPVAERSGLIDDIGAFVMRQACRQVGAWKAEGLDGLKVAINVSARQFHDPRLIGMLSEAIADAGIEGSRLEVELTESAAMADHEHTRRAFKELSKLGVAVAIDDFGTGYASMSYLRKLPFDKLKIDREFVSHIDTLPGSRAICDAIIALSNGLGLKVLAEGVERQEEVDYLAKAGCALFQGYHFARPVAAEAMPEVLADIRMSLLERREDRATQRLAMIA